MKRFIVASTLFFATACAQVGLAPAQSISEQIGYGYSTVTATRITAVQALAAGTIKAADAQQVQNLADQARVLLDGARAALPAPCPTAAPCAQDTSTAAGKLALATGVLTQLQAYLKTTTGGK